MQNLKKIRAFVSVTDKTGLDNFLKNIKKYFPLEITATSGTGAFLKRKGLGPKLVEEITNYPPILKGRVKSLHPLIYGAILADPNNSDHVKDLKKYRVRPFNMVVINLYEFEKSIKEYPDNLDRAVEHIDIGGPSAVRAAAKNFQNVIPVCDPSDYSAVSKILKNQGNLNFNQRKKLAVKCFRLNIDYNQIIVKYFKNA